MPLAAIDMEKIYSILILLLLTSCGQNSESINDSEKTDTVNQYVEAVIDKVEVHTHEISDDGSIVNSKVLDIKSTTDPNLLEKFTRLLPEVKNNREYTNIPHEKTIVYYSKDSLITSLRVTGRTYHKFYGMEGTIMDTVWIFTGDNQRSTTMEINEWEDLCEQLE